ncbi:hypothetical protein [Rhodococcus qingshengii]|uniref:hypothetical protein n=1 Tax=Rhodococcus qingshengii TaxID=334542 RepID=UPI00301B1175
MPPVPGADADLLVLGSKLSLTQCAGPDDLSVDGADVSGVDRLIVVVDDEVCDVPEVFKQYKVGAGEDSGQAS